MLTTPGDVVAFDEFTSVVDRNVARIGSAAVAKSLRKGHIAKRFVAVTCHYDVIDWLAPDWVLDMASCRLARGCLRQRPSIDIELAPVHRSAWQLFRRHHYLNHDLQPGAKCFVAFWGDEPVAFTSWLHAMIPNRQPNDMREHRTVVLPDYQGVGIGNRVSELAASIWRGLGGRALSTSSHPGMMHYRSKSPHWRAHRFGRGSPQGRSGHHERSRRKSRGNAYFRQQRDKQRAQGNRASDSSGRVTAGFEYIGPATDRARAEQLVAAKPDVFLPSGAMAAVLERLTRDHALAATTLARRTGFSVSRVASVLEELADHRHATRVRIGKRRVAWSLSSFTTYRG